MRDDNDDFKDDDKNAHNTRLLVDANRSGNENEIEIENDRWVDICSTNLYCLVYQPIILQGGGLASEQQSRLDLPSPGKESNSYSNNKFPGRSVEAKANSQGTHE